MKTQAGVKSAVLGGRPDNKGPMQGVGGTKGFQYQSFDVIYELVRIAAGLPQLASVQQIDQVWFCLEANFLSIYMLTLNYSTSNRT